jgi:hypothetical protein
MPVAVLIALGVYPEGCDLPEGEHTVTIEGRAAGENTGTMTSEAAILMVAVTGNYEFRVPGCSKHPLRPER